MPEEIKGCSTCALLRELKSNGEYYSSRRPDKKDKCVTLCKAVVVMEDYYKNCDGELEYGGRISYNPRPMNFCSECGRKLENSELTW